MSGRVFLVRRATRRLIWGATRLTLLVAAGTLPGQPGDSLPHAIESEPLAEAARALRSGDLDGAIKQLDRCIQADPLDPRPYREIVDALIRRGDAAQAERFLRARAEKHPGNPSPHYALGKLFYMQGDLGHARSEAGEALRRDPRHGYASLLLGLVEYTEGHTRSALQSWKRARRDLVRKGDRIGQTLVLNNLAMVHLDLHQYERARSEYEHTRRLQRAMGNSEGERIALSNLGLTLTDMGQYDQAVGVLLEARALSRRMRDPVGECRVLEYLCDAHQKMGLYEMALGDADSLIALARRSGYPVGEAAGLLNNATSRNDLGEPLAALRSCERGLALAESLGHPRYQSALLVTLGETEMRLGRSDEARAAFRRCDSLSRATGVDANAATAVAGQSQLALQEGDTARARQLGEEALALCSRIGYVEGEGQNAGLLSELALARGDLREAESLAERSLVVSRQVGRRVEVARALARRAQVRLAGMDASGAWADAREGQRIAREIGSQEAEAICAMAAGDAVRRRNREDALEAYRAGISIVESVQGKLRLDEFKAGYLQSRRELYYKAADLLVEMNRPEEALEISERSRARAFRDFLASGPRDREVVGGPVSESREGGDARGGSAPRPRAGAILRALDLHEAVLEYFLGPSASLCLVARTSGVVAVRLAITASEAATLVERLRRSLNSPRSLATLSVDEETAGRLRQRLVDPVRSFFAGADLLYIVPDGPLHYLPLEMLPESPAESSIESRTSMTPAAVSSSLGAGEAPEALYASLRDRSYLCDRYAICYLPAAGLLCRRETEAPPPFLAHPGRLLALGSSEAGLLHATQEVDRIGRMFPDAVVLAGALATEQAFKSLAPGCRVLHLAAHGTVDPAAPLYSGLRLAADGEGMEDGFLHAFEVLPLRLHCDLVTLSACESGLGRLYAGEGLFGLARSFLCAGASRTLVSLWRVNDESTTRFMQLFYSALSAGVPAAQALRQARRAMRDEVMVTPEGRRISLAHPFFWAPFVLVEGGGF